MDQTPDPVSQAVKDVVSERIRQIRKEGWDAAHDDTYRHGQLEIAAARYAYNAAMPLRFIPAQKHRVLNGLRDVWPWAAVWWKPKSPREDLVRAGALILAAIERLDREQEVVRVPGEPLPPKDRPEKESTEAHAGAEPTRLSVSVEHVDHLTAGAGIEEKIQACVITAGPFPRVRADSIRADSIPAGDGLPREKIPPGAITAGPTPHVTAESLEDFYSRAGAERPDSSDIDRRLRIMERMIKELHRGMFGETET